MKITAGSVTICTITLKSGTGSCVLSATRLPVGSYGVQAHYAGNGDFTASLSVGKTLTVVK